MASAGAVYFCNVLIMYEIPVLKVFTEPLLNAVPASSPHYPRACELLHLLTFFNPMSATKVPLTRCISVGGGGGGGGA